MPRPRVYLTNAERQAAYRQARRSQQLPVVPAPATDVPRAPFPHFGGKHQVAAVVWERFGPVRHYLEPFAGSLAVLLTRPHPPQIETVNDLDGQITNVWRALAQDPRAVAHYADRPVNELDMHAAAAGCWHSKRRWPSAYVLTSTTMTRKLQDSGSGANPAGLAPAGASHPAHASSDAAGARSPPSRTRASGCSVSGYPGNVPTSLMAAALSGRIPPRARGSWPGSKPCSTGSDACVCSAATGRGSSRLQPSMGLARP